MELKPCPFCGSPAKQGYQLLCSNDNCPNENRDEQGATFITEAQWNTRPIEDALQAQIDALEAEIAELKADDQWRPVNEFPEEGQEVWACEEGNPIISRFRFSRNLAPVFTRHYTRWQPVRIPKSPEK